MNRLRAGGGGAGGDSFSPFSLYAGGTEKGLWLDPSASSTGYQDTIGTAGVLNQPIGTRLDKRLGAALGSELITVAADRDFSSDTGYWTKNAGVTISGGACVFTAVANGLGLQKGGLVSAGKFYEVSFEITAYTAGGFAIYAGGTLSAAKTAVGVHTVRVVAGSSDTVLQLYAVGETTGSADNISHREVTGNHVRQSTAAARPAWKLNGSIYSDLLDGVDDGYATATLTAGTLSADMDLFLVVKRNSSAAFVLASEDTADATRYIGLGSSGSGTAAVAGAGTLWSVFADGLQVGAVNSVTGDQLNTAMPSGAYKVVEFRNLDLSAWTKFTLGLYTSFMLSADVAGVIACPAQTSSVRTQIRRWLGAKAGLTL
jgi:hypothetical protein